MDDKTGDDIMGSKKDAWIEWKKICELAKCTKEHRELLNSYADSVLRKATYKITYSEISSDSFLHGAAFAYFERHSLQKTYSRKEDEFRGKSYKDGIFMKASKNEKAAQNIIDGSFNLYLKSAIREVYKDEWKKYAGEFSANKPVKNGSDMTYQDFLPDVVNINRNLEDQDLQEQAEECKLHLFKILAFEEKAILLSVFLGLSYSTSKALQQTTSLSKSTLGYHFKKLFKEHKYLPLIKSLHPDVSQEIAVILYGYVMILMKDEIISWGNSETRCKPLFIEYEGQNVSSNGGTSNE